MKNQDSIPGQEELFVTQSPDVGMPEAVPADAPRTLYDGTDPRDARRVEILSETLGWSPDRVSRTVIGTAAAAVSSEVARPAIPAPYRSGHTARPARYRPNREQRFGDEVGTNFPDGQPAEHQPRVVFDEAGLARLRRGVATAQEVLDARGIGRNR